MTRLKLLPCLKSKCDAIWLRDMNSPKAQYVEAYWKRPIKDGEDAFLCHDCYAHVQEVVARRAVFEAELLSRMQGPVTPEMRATLEAWTDME